MCGGVIPRQNGASRHFSFCTAVSVARLHVPHLLDLVSLRTRDAGLLPVNCERYAEISKVTIVPQFLESQLRTTPT